LHTSSSGLSLRNPLYFKASDHVVRLIMLTGYAVPATLRFQTNTSVSGVALPCLTGAPDYIALQISSISLGRLAGLAEARSAFHTKNGFPLFSLN
jgi:hypothetical protein